MGCYLSFTAFIQAAFSFVSADEFHEFSCFRCKRKFVMGIQYTTFTTTGKYLVWKYAERCDSACTDGFRSNPYAKQFASASLDKYSSIIHNDFSKSINFGDITAGHGDQCRGGVFDHSYRRIN